MNLIGFGEFKYVDGREEYFARFQRENAEDGFFDMPLTEPQLVQMLEEVRGKHAAPAALPSMPAPTKTGAASSAKRAAAPPPDLLDDDEIDGDTAPIRLVASMGDDE